MRKKIKSTPPTASLPKNLRLTWKDISYTIQRKSSAGGLRAFCGFQKSEVVRLLDGGTLRIEKKKLWRLGDRLILCFAFSQRYYKLWDVDGYHGTKVITCDYDLFFHLLCSHLFD